jgi:uncharacterized protein YndB with AHSA1/START domain
MTGEPARDGVRAILSGMSKTDGFTLQLSTTLAAPRERVFELLTDPGELRRWWGPHGFTTPEIDLDLRVGGSYRFTMQPPEGAVFHIRGVFTEIAPAERLAYTFAYEEPAPNDVETLVTLSLQDSPAGGTALSLGQGAFATEARLALHHAGWSDGLEKLAALTSP